MGRLTGPASPWTAGPSHHILRLQAQFHDAAALLQEGLRKQGTAGVAALWLLHPKARAADAGAAEAAEERQVMAAGNDEAGAAADGATAVAVAGLLELVAVAAAVASPAASEVLGAVQTVACAAALFASRERPLAVCCPRQALRQMHDLMPRPC